MNRHQIIHFYFGNTFINRLDDVVWQVIYNYSQLISQQITCSISQKRTRLSIIKKEKRNEV